MGNALKRCKTAGPSCPWMDSSGSDKGSNEVMVESMKAAADFNVEKLEFGSYLYEQAFERFRSKWMPGTWQKPGAADVPLPTVRAIYKFSIERADFDKRQEGMRDRKRFGKHAGVGNCLSRFHGTRMTCNFDGTPCDDKSCSACCIIKDKMFRPGKGQQSGTSIYGEGIYFTSMAHSAKGYGLRPDKTRPPKSLTDFVSPDAGNAVFIALVLAGTVNKVESIGYVDGQGPQISEELDTLKYDSTCVNKDTGNDELVIPRSDQAKLQYLLVFGAQ